MKAERVSQHIWALKLWLGMPVRVWLVTGADGVTLVDAGLPLMAGAIDRLVTQLGAGPLQRILLTHGHGDHVGAVRPLLAKAPVPVYAHSRELPPMQGEIPYPGRKKAQAFLPAGIAEPLPADADGRLQPLGRLTPYLTPGHAPGHVVYWHEADRVLLAGDLFMSRRGRLQPPMAMFTADMPTAIASGRVVTDLVPERLEVSHGGPVFEPAAQFAQYWQRYAVPQAG